MDVLRTRAHAPARPDRIGDPRDQRSFHRRATFGAFLETIARVATSSSDVAAETKIRPALATGRGAVVVPVGFSVGHGTRYAAAIGLEPR